ncbi:AtuA-related protein [Neorhizobium sp. LjRoot104]|uniref:AtuA-related protein n=1 Tax=Neorhizobium sp. LjRoot104 TaxID=3342254 RepID=UPI003F50440E
MNSARITVPLHVIAHGRSGDKGNRLNVNVIAYQPQYWPILLEQVTAARIAELFAHRGATNVVRYELPKLQALNFVIDDALEGGVNSSLSLDTHGKTLSFLVLDLPVELPLQTLPAGRTIRADQPNLDPVMGGVDNE